MLSCDIDHGKPLYCSVQSQFWQSLVDVWYWVDALLGDFIPFVVVFTGNCVIVAKIVAANRQRSQQMHVVADNNVHKVS